MFQTEQAGRPEILSGLTQALQWFCEFNVSSSESPAGRTTATPGAQTEHAHNTQRVSGLPQ